MAVFGEKNAMLQAFLDNGCGIIETINNIADVDDIKELRKVLSNFKKKTDDFYREDRKLNVGVIGQVKAGKSSFLNTLLFGGKDVLPKASTPKTATLTKMEYSSKNLIKVEYYSFEDWEVIEDNSKVNSDEIEYASARELVKMASSNGVDYKKYLQKGVEEIEFSTYEDLIANLNDYVGENGRFTPLVKAVTLEVNKEEFKELSIVDTPGLNDPIASRTLRTKEFMRYCDVVFFLSQSSSFLDSNDWNLLSTQLPHDGVKRLVLIASKFDSGVRDVLRKKDDEDFIFEDDEVADDISKACQLVSKKLRKHVKKRIEDYVKDLKDREASEALIAVVNQCSKPVFVSSLAYNMSNKVMDDYTKEEENLSDALKCFSSNLQEDLLLLGNFDVVKKIFDEVVLEKGNILRQKERDFIPVAKDELLELLGKLKDKALNRVNILESSDKKQLIERKECVAKQQAAVKSDITSIFGELNSKLEYQKAETVKDIREISKDYLSVKERVGERVHVKSYSVSDSTWYKPSTWGKSHREYYTYTEKYTYCLASDATENLHKYAIEATNKVENVFTETIALKELRRRLLNVIVNNFDMGDERYDSALFRIMVEEVIAKIEFPVFKIDIAKEIDAISTRFSGEITSGGERNALVNTLSNAIGNFYKELSDKLTETVSSYKNSMTNIGNDIENRILENINSEFEILLEQVENKEREISRYQEYVNLLKREINKI